MTSIMDYPYSPFLHDVSEHLWVLPQTVKNVEWVALITHDRWCFALCPEKKQQQQSLDQQV